ncbi:uncharacterized protein RJT21DRAFT_54259 [Scheffersomyces amazonensis]|uniref:uncharacterized protein n=1 Tax=Scheffersomyces amazonensis TaxID=1078765 RepID=UPI00315D0901
MNGVRLKLKDVPRSGVVRQIYRLNKIAGTPSTAFKFNDSKYSKIELCLIQKNVFEPALGLKNFWRDNLPTLKFHNENIDFIMTRIKPKNKKEVKACPVFIKVHGKDSIDDILLDVRNHNPETILRKLVESTKAKRMSSEEIPFIRAPEFGIGAPEPSSLAEEEEDLKIPYLKDL